ncbi:sulfate transporter family-domain-containing protein [Lobosporangium transversale]|uniref:Sulfate transporter family-domain-containing protein n=1 Tax=Lobosporangium transversale TaxID=64571 RepID=A0A1Y2G9I1_9FUNG|nr:sulfate transporter family-domain-containing protein [Lobosporangium transversale]ORZ04832.1 sulfate transporter family-domain-containing protein [Lobosporangium transversale]|eukprot:XP_021876769.1 sulfate transporter family-domain-containing protein [Lobosporangium transversale]
MTRASQAQSSRSPRYSPVQVDSSDSEDNNERTPFVRRGREYQQPTEEDDLYEPVSPGADLWTTFKNRLRYYVPVFRWLPHYSMDGFGHDFIAGMTVACLIIPQSLSYATALAHLEPVHGLYTAFIPGVLYAIFGTSRQLSVGPEALVSMMVGTAIAQQQHASGSSDPNVALAIACYITLFVGLFTFFLGFVRLGFLDSVLSRALLRGFITAVAVVVIIEQSISLFGLRDLAEESGIGEQSSTVEKLVFIIEEFKHIHVLTTVVSFSSIVFLLSFGSFKKRLTKLPFLQFVPEILLCVILYTVLTAVFRWDKDGLAVLGATKAAGIQFPSIPAAPEGVSVRSLFGTSVLISIIGFVESIVISKQYANKHNYTVSPNRELVAMGIANIFGGLFQAIPAFGSLSRSKINDKAGARTQLAGLITALIVLLAIFFLLPYFFYLPKAVLAGIICVAALSLLSEAPHDIKFWWQIQAWSDLGLLLLTFFATITVSVEAGTLIAIALSFLLVIKTSTYPRITIMGRMPGTKGKFRPIKDYPGIAEHIDGVLVVKVEEALYFANTGQLKDRLHRLEVFGDMSVHPSEEARLNPVSHVIFDVENMPSLDASACQILLEIVEAYHARHIKVYFVKLRENSRELFVKSGLLKRAGGDSHLFRRTADAMDYIERESLALNESEMQV